jgi:tRNA(fMet)-specific endonuclease VapC
MSLYILDTDTVSLWQQGNPAVQRQRAAHPFDVISVSIITVEEQWMGWQGLLRQPLPRCKPRPCTSA